MADSDIQPAIITRLRKKRDLETTMTTLKQLLEPKKGTRKKNKPRSLAKKVSPKKRERFESTEDGEYYPYKVKRKVKLDKTVLKPKHELKIVASTNKRKRCTPLKGSKLFYGNPDSEDKPPDISVPSDPDSNIFMAGKVQTTNVALPGLRAHKEPVDLPKLKVYTELVDHASKSNTEPANQEIYKLISPPHRSLTQLTADDLIRMDEDSLSDENLMEILTCPSPVWWEDPADVSRGTVYLTKATEYSTISHANNEGKTKSIDNALKRASVSVTVNKAKKIAKLENVLGHIKSLIPTDTVNNDNLTDNGHNLNDNDVNLTDNDVNLNNNDNNLNDNDDSGVVNNEIDIDVVEVKENNDFEVNNVFEVSKQRKISSSGSEISVSEDLLKNLENINIPIRQMDSESPKNDLVNENVTIDESVEISVEAIKEEHNMHDELPVTIEQNKTEGNKEQKQEHSHDTNKSGANAEQKSILKRLEKNDDILDVRQIKIPTNVTNEIKVWSKLDNFKRHNFKLTDFDDIIDIEEEDEFDFSLGAKKEKIIIPSKVKDPLEVNINDETIFIDDSTDASDIDIDNMNENNADNDSQNEVIEIHKDTPVIRICNDLDVRLIDSDMQETVTENTDTNVIEKDVNLATENWHVSKYLQYNETTNDRGIFRVLDDDDDDANDTILCLNDVDVSLVNKPKTKEKPVTNTINDLSITLISKDFTVTPINKIMTTESPKSVKSLNSESTMVYSDTISDTNIQFLDEYDDLDRNELGIKINDIRTENDDINVDNYLTNESREIIADLEIEEISSVQNDEDGENIKETNEILDEENGHANVNENVELNEIDSSDKVHT